mmetsp:Transcript_10767/g.24773  ORF Transcript_10767/g.24773 Transcript_10767/m.24773 type:complete len:224 (+) Transcript_10767:751-1422(+)
MRTHPVIVCFCPAQCSPCCFNPALDAASGAGFLHCLIPRGQRTASMQGGQRCFAPGKLHMSERDGTVFLYGEARRGFGQTDHESAAALCRKHFGERYHIQFGLPPAVAALREQQRIHHRKETEAAVKVQALQRGASARKLVQQTKRQEAAAVQIQAARRKQAAIAAAEAEAESKAAAKAYAAAEAAALKQQEQAAASIQVAFRTERGRKQKPDQKGNKDCVVQ